MESEWVTFVETTAFSRRLQRLNLEAGLRDLQIELARNPELGVLESGTGGLRKIRMPSPERSKGKRGGARVHYLWLPHRRRIYLLFVFEKDEQESLTSAQRKQLKQIVDQIAREAQTS
jgi:hypothetical protein